MQFELRDKFKTQGDLEIEIIGIRPGSQGVQMLNLEENYYEITINGYRSMMSEKVLAKLIKDVKKDIDVIANSLNIEEITTEDVKKETSETEENNIKIKRGRKPKGE